MSSESSFSSESSTISSSSSSTTSNTSHNGAVSNANILHQHRFKLDTLPNELIFKIINYLNLDGLSGFIEDEDILTINKSIYQAIGHFISQSKLSFNNRLNYFSFQHMYKLTPTYEDKSNYQYIADNVETAVKVLHRFESFIPTTESITISYYIWQLTDLIELLDLLPNLSSEFKYNLELEFDPDIEYIFNSSKLIQQLQSLPSLISLLIYNYKQKFTIDISKFPHLIRLWLDNCQLSVTQSESYFHSTGFDLKIDINSKEKFKGIKLNLQSFTFIDHLSLAGNGIEMSSATTSDLSNILKTLQLSNVATLFNYKSIQNLQSLYMEDLVYNSFKFTQDLLDKSPNLHTLSLTGNHYDIMNPLNLGSTQLKVIKLTKFDPNIISTMVYPKTLLELNIANNSLTDLTFINSITQIPSTLRKLNLADNNIHWRRCIPYFKRFNQLLYLKMSNTGIHKELEYMDFPDSIETLSLEVNKITSIEDVEFPLNLKDLGLGCNSIRRITPSHLLPKGLHTLHLTENRLRSNIHLSTNDRYDLMELQVLYLDSNQIKGIDYMDFPTKLRILNLDRNQLRSIQCKFQASIQELSIAGNDLRDFEIRFAKESKLKVLDLSSNYIQEFDNSVIPTTLQILKLKDNDIGSISLKSFTSFPHLKYIDISHNNMCQFDGKFNENLQTLIINSNSLISFKITFPAGSQPKIRRISINHNSLKSISASNLGFSGQKGVSSQLEELDIFDNPLLKNNSKSLSYINEGFSGSLSSLFAKPGSEDRFGSKYSLNILPNAIGVEKRIDDNWKSSNLYLDDDDDDDDI
ncbi:hypothetical protein DFJ63DRAFT_334204 [Scheffersomyces coipomensis]|uniref:uncharacterized protein n=1 Tax=Scheffersomyces coipomensis TaxID=1788519 RepID=UPI00315DF612